MIVGRAARRPRRLVRQVGFRAGGSRALAGTDRGDGLTASAASLFAACAAALGPFLRDPVWVAGAQCRRPPDGRFKVASLSSPSPKGLGSASGRSAGVLGSVNHRIPQGGNQR